MITFGTLVIVSQLSLSAQFYGCTNHGRTSGMVDIDGKVKYYYVQLDGCSPESSTKDWLFPVNQVRVKKGQKNNERTNHQ